MRSECTVDGCQEFVTGQGLCRKHYMRKRRTGTTDDTRKNARGTCSTDGCDRPHQAGGLCRPHWLARRTKAARLAGKLAQPRMCGFCGGAIDPTKRRRGPVSYCSRNCKEKAWVAAGKNAIATKKAYFKRRYRLTPEQVEEMAAAGCSICGTTDWPGRHSRPHVDHDHRNGVVRGILCSECNTGLGKFRDNPALLRAAADYLERAQAPTP